MTELFSPLTLGRATLANRLAVAPMTTSQSHADGTVSDAEMAWLERVAEDGYGMVITSLQAGRWQEEYTLHGSGHSLVLEAFSRLRLIDGPQDTVQEETYASSWLTTLEGRGFNGQINHFLDCIKDRRLPLTSGWDSVKTQQMLEQMIARVTYSQAETGH